MTAPDAPRPAANVTDVLAAHDWFTPRGYAWPCCTCGEEFPDGEDAAFAHVAAALAEAGIGPLGVCDCYPFGFTPDTYEGPQETCPVHGRPYAEWVERATTAEEELAALRGPVAEAERRGAEAVLAERDALAAAVDRVRRRHPRGDEEAGYLAPGLWCPTCGRERTDNGYSGCPDRQALIIPGQPLRGNVGAEQAGGAS